MKTMNCNELGGACSTSFQANTFEEIANQSKAHAMEMLNKGDEAHMAAMNKMKDQSPEEMYAWFEEKKAAFNNLAEDQ